MASLSASGRILADAFDRVRETVTEVLDGVAEPVLTWRPDAEANTVAWLVWHLTRVQDDHLAHAFGRTQVWHEQGWVDRFDLPFEPDATGYGQRSDEVGQVRAEAALLAGYHAAVAQRTAALLADLGEDDLERIVDERWDPPVTMAVRLVSVISDDLQHAGQAAYLRGLAERSGVRG
jgi:hypothetical protein